MDLVIIFVMGILLSNVMKMHGTWKPLSGIGDFIAWGMVCVFAFLLVRIPIYILCYGVHLHYDASLTVQLMSGVLAIAFWYAMLYWRIPMRLLGRK